MSIRTCTIVDDHFDRDRLGEVAASLGRYEHELSAIWKDVFSYLWASASREWKWLPVAGFANQPTFQMRREGAVALRGPFGFLVTFGSKASRIDHQIGWFSFCVDDQGAQSAIRQSVLLLGECLRYTEVLYCPSHYPEVMLVEEGEDLAEICLQLRGRYGAPAPQPASLVAKDEENWFRDGYLRERLSNGAPGAGPSGSTLCF